MKNLKVEVRQLDYGFLLKTMSTDSIYHKYPDGWEFESARESLQDVLSTIADRFEDEDLSLHIRKFERSDPTKMEGA